MLDLISKYWWAFVLRGVISIIFGILAYTWPGMTLTILIFLFGAYSLIDGIFALIGAIAGKQHSDRWWVLLLEGIVGIAIGIMAFLAPGITTLALLMYIAFWALLTGLLEIIAAVRLRKEIEGEWWMILSGVASIIFAVLLFLYPSSGALAMVWIIAAYAILFGVFLIMLGFKLRSRRSKLAVA